MKKLLLVVLIAIFAIASVTMTACGNSGKQNSVSNGENQNNEMENNEQEPEFEGEIVGEIFELEEAYEKGYVTVETLEQIANYVNADAEYPQPLSKNIDSAIREAAAERMRTRERDPLPWAEAKGFTVVCFYGFYSNCYAVCLGDIFELRPTDVPHFDREIGGVQFHYFGYNSFEIFVVQS